MKKLIISIIKILAGIIGLRAEWFTPPQYVDFVMVVAAILLINGFSEIIKNQTTNQ
jgi:hypothetical protein